MNLYMVFDRKQTLAILVAADAGSEGSLGQIEKAYPSLGWTVADTYTRKIMGNVDLEPGVLAAIPLFSNAVIPLKKDRSWKSAKKRRSKRHHGPTRKQEAAAATQRPQRSEGAQAAQQVPAGEAGLGRTGPCRPAADNPAAPGARRPTTAEGRRG